ncbi:hypothetical protein HK101_005708 [Irineochytrium annulatum]|nr:hypothetical protein HK101_005708 [Irineochytrium annulatum]
MIIGTDGAAEFEVKLYVESADGVDVAAPELNPTTSGNVTTCHVEAVLGSRFSLSLHYIANERLTSRRAWICECYVDEFCVDSIIIQHTGTHDSMRIRGYMLDDDHIQMLSFARPQWVEGPGTAVKPELVGSVRFEFYRGKAVREKGSMEAAPEVRDPTLDEQSKRVATLGCTASFGAVEACDPVENPVFFVDKGPMKFKAVFNYNTRDVLEDQGILLSKGALKELLDKAAMIKQDLLATGKRESSNGPAETAPRVRRKRVKASRD